MDFHYPVEMAGTGFISRFAANNHLFHPRANMVWLQVNPFQQRLANDGFKFDRHNFVKRQTLIRTVLIFNGTANGYKRIALSHSTKKMGASLRRTH